MESRYRIKKSFRVGGTKYAYFSLPDLENAGISVSRMPITLRILLESMVRNHDGIKITDSDIEALAAQERDHEKEISFKVSRVIMQDLTGIPAIVDLASMREKMQSLSLDPGRINPDVPVDLVIDHSIQVDYFGSGDAFEKNVKTEFQRNAERYRFLKWARQAFKNVNVVPPSVGIVHQVNLEYLASVVSTRELHGITYAFNDSLVGTDSHTTMVNGIGVFGWGVGGLEAESAMLGEPISMQIPLVVGVRLVGKLNPGVTATDLVLTLTSVFRKHNVVGKFIEFFGPGVGSLGGADRATVSNMCPEYGATTAYFPVDSRTLEYLTQTGRKEEQVQLVTEYLKAQDMFGIKDDLIFDEVIQIDLAGIEPTVAGPRLPQQKVPLADSSNSFLTFLEEDESRVTRTKSGVSVHLKQIPISMAGNDVTLSDGDVVIAAITSCTNTSNPRVMIGAGLLARKAYELGLRTSPKVKTSLAPGSRIVSDYLSRSGLQEYLNGIGFYLVGYGCTTCIGNSGPLPDPVQKAIDDHKLKVVSVLSGNRNFESRIHKDVSANYLMSPPLVVAFALAGTINIDLTTEPIGKGSNGNDVFLRDIWPSDQEIDSVVAKFLSSDSFVEKYRDVESYNKEWNDVRAPSGEIYQWDPKSTYIRDPPYFDSFSADQEREFRDIENCYPLTVLGDSVTTDHISPAGPIAKSSPAALYLQAKGVAVPDFNTYGARRGNHEVLIRGTFANTRIKNLLAEKEGWYTSLLPEKKETSVFEASQEYRKRGNSVVVIAGSEYGSGSSRDWAAKGPFFLGVRAVIAKSFERIHRNNLVGMGLIPLQFRNGMDYGKMDLDVTKPITIHFPDSRAPKSAGIVYTTTSGKASTVEVIVRLDTPLEYEYFRKGGILQYVLAGLVSEKEN